MTFEEVYEALNNAEIALVAQEMRKWHPAILSQMLLAIQAAKEMRYRSPHPDYYTALQVLNHRCRKPRQKVARFSKADGNLQVTLAVKRMEEGRGR